MESIDYEIRRAIYDNDLGLVKKLFPEWKDVAIRGASAFAPTRSAFLVSTKMLDHILDLECFKIEQKKKMPYIWGGMFDRRFGGENPDADTWKELEFVRRQAKRLLSAGISPNEFSGWNALFRGQHPIHCAISRGDILGVEILMENGFDPEHLGGFDAFEKRMALVIRSSSGYYSFHADQADDRYQTPSKAWDVFKGHYQARVLRKELLIDLLGESSDMTNQNANENNNEKSGLGLAPKRKLKM